MKVEDFTGETLKELRRKHKLTQTELGERLGIKFQSLSRWESGRGEISIPYRHLFILFFKDLEKIDN